MGRFLREIKTERQGGHDYRMRNDEENDRDSPCFTQEGTFQNDDLASIGLIVRRYLQKRLVDNDDIGCISALEVLCCRSV